MKPSIDLFHRTGYPQFSDLQLAREPNGAISFSSTAMEHFCRALGRALDTLSEDDLGALIAVHYLWHCVVAGGDPVPVVESLLPQALVASRN